jgi:hypothetical protein
MWRLVNRRPGWPMVPSRSSSQWSAPTWPAIRAVRRMVRLLEIGPVFCGSIVAGWNPN